MARRQGLDPVYGKRMAILPSVFNMSDADFARSLGINQDQWWTYKIGKSRPRKDTMDRLYKAYGITADYVWLGLIDGIRRDDVRDRINRALAKNCG